MTTLLFRGNESGEILDAAGQVIGRVVALEPELAPTLNHALAETVLVVRAAIHLGLVEDIDGEAEGAVNAIAVELGGSFSAEHSVCTRVTARRQLPSASNVWERKAQKVTSGE